MERRHLKVGLSARDCYEVARILDSGISMFSCNPDETEGAER